MRPPGEAALDVWTWAHVASGAALALLGLRPGTALALLVAFEGFEAALRRPGGRGLFEHESAENIITDVAAGAAGYRLARALRRPRRLETKGA